jgi:hypothetical protein
MVYMEPLAELLLFFSVTGIYFFSLHRLLTVS